MPRITLEEMIKMTQRYRVANPNGIWGETISPEDTALIMDQANYIQTRIYFGMDDQNQTRVILVGVDASGNDLLEAGIIIDRAQKYP